MKRNLLIFGAGQYGCVAKETAEAMNCYESIAFLDDNSCFAIGKIADYEAYKSQFSMAFVAIGNSKLRCRLLSELETAGYELALLVHPQACVMPSVQLGKGSIVEAMAVVNSNTEISEGCIISAGAVVNHDSVLGKCCHLDCGAIVPARSILPEGTKVPCGQVYQE